MVSLIAVTTLFGPVYVEASKEYVTSLAEVIP